MQSHCLQHNLEKEGSQLDLPHARFQRSDQWIPVYSWLESLDTDAVIKSKDISDWLSANPVIKDQLLSRHSRYHLVHYIKKCHVKILRRRENRKGLHQANKATPLKAAANKSVPLPCNPFKDLPKDDDLYIAKRNEALRKYEILVELERELATVFHRSQDVRSLEEP